MRRILAGLLAVLALEPADVVASGTRVVAIGNNLGRAGDATLRYAERDAERFAQVMRQLGRIPGENVVTLRNEGAARIRQVLMSTRAALQAGPEPDLLVVYYSGHADADGLHPGPDPLPYRELRQLVLSARARLRLLVIDSCRSGALTRVKGTRPAAPFEVRPDTRSLAIGTAIVTSSAANEDSQESDRLAGSFFTHHLVSGLRGAADRNRDAKVTLEEAYHYAYHQTLRASGRTASLQHPTFQYAIRGKGDAALTWLASDRRASSRLRIPEPGHALVLERSESGVVVAEAAVEPGGAVLSLPPGRYVVQHRTRGFFREYRVDLPAGAEVSLAGLPFRTVAYARLVRKGAGRRLSHSLTFMGAARGEVLDGDAVTPHGVLGYGLDLPWLTVGLRFRVSGARPERTLRTLHMEYALGLTLERFIDLRHVSLSFGLLVEGALHTQRFESAASAPDRQVWAFGFGALVGLEIDVLPALLLRLEGGPMAQVFERAVLESGVQVATETATPVTWWAGAGVVWRF